MSLDVLLVPALGGYWLLTHLHYTRFRAVRESGYHVLFRAALFGGILFAVSEALLFLLVQPFPQVQDTLDSIFPGAYYDSAVLSVALGLTVPLVGNRFYPAKRARIRVAQEVGDLVELILSDSIDGQKPVELSLRNGKSYIGSAVDSGIGRHGETDVSIIPMASGYRDKDTQELRITTHYTPVILRLQEQTPGFSVDDFRVVIPISEIVSARIFLPAAYRLFQEEHA